MKRPSIKSKQLTKAELQKKKKGTAPTSAQKKVSSKKSVSRSIKKNKPLKANVKRKETGALKNITTENQRLTRQLEQKNRELEIEAALERVRASTMAMHNSSELIETAKLLFDQLKQLGAESSGVAFAICEHDNVMVKKWTSIGVFSVPYTIESGEQRMYEAWKNQIESYEEVYEGEKLRKYLELFMEIPEFRAGFQKFLNTGIPFPTWQKNHAITFKYGYLLLITSKPFEETHIFTRFAKVFEQTYTRFLDLQQAEVQAREAQIEAALERVRSRTMAMQHSSELAETSFLLAKQVRALGIKAFGCAFNIFDEDEKSSTEWFSNEEGYLPTYNTPRVGLFLRYYEAAQRGELLHVEEIAGEACAAHYRYLSTLPVLGDIIKKYSESGVALPTFQIDHVAYFKHGYLLFVTYQPVPEAHEIFKRFAKVFEQTYTRFLDLQKAEAQAREAQIEVSLERVRSKAMAMQKSEDLASVVAIVFDELDKLKLGTLRCGIGIIDKETRSTRLWTTTVSDNNSVVQVSGDESMDIHPLLSGIFEAWLKQEDDFEYVLQGKDLNDYYKALTGVNFKLPDSQSLVSGAEEVQQFHYNALFPAGGLFAFRETPFPDEAKTVMRRFADAFTLTYTRFNDLKQAEAQAREAQIEAALERVRSRSMAMHKSEELLEVITVVSEQLQHLKLKFNTVSFANNNQEHDYKFWFAAMGDPNPLYIQVPYLNNPMYDRMKEVLASGTDFYADTLTPEESRQWHEHMFANADLSFLSEETKAYILHSGYARSVAITPSIMLIVSNYAARPYTDDENDIIRRFAAVFQQSYTRFLDLKKAEAQAREAQVEVALERVRSRAMAMQTSEELNALIGTVFTELTKLDLVLTRCLIMTYDQKTNDARWWMTNSEAPEQPMNFFVRYHEHLPNLAYLDAWRQRTLKWVYTLEGVIKKEWDDYIFSETELSLLPDFVIGGMRAPDRVFLNASFYNFGNLTLASLEPLSDEHFDILIRFARVFDLTYTRFNDIKQAEAREKEAIKQSALDRVRAEIASMRTAKDLERITPLIWKELTTLNISFIRCGVFIMDEEQQVIHAFLSTPDGKAIAALHLPYDSAGRTAEILSHWKNNQNYIRYWDISAFEELADQFVAQGVISSKEQYMKTVPEEGIHLYCLLFLQGMFYVGNTSVLKEDDILLVQSLADAFSTAYARYEDFNKLEAAKQQVDKTLVDLKLAQQQLVQSEKMASLGELTAGIAHEIQNPLNFVNNFSELNKELIAEIREEIGKKNYDEVEQIAKDLEENEEKIIHHGKRADAIVKGMLQHSRISSGVKELTNINALVDEYVRLAYHGLRAKDNSFNATMKTDFDETIGSINIIPRDMGRVILNLINNAFYAVSEKKKQQPDGYEPTVTVSTRRSLSSGEGRGEAEITLRDNGNGIPPKVLDKIFQPFFTTKPPGQGTGLGLSLSYDIVKAHGGEIKVETTEGEGTEFIIYLSVK